MRANGVAIPPLPLGCFTWQGRGERAPVRKIVAGGRTGGRALDGSGTGASAYSLKVVFQSPCRDCEIAHSPLSDGAV
jgi:hypothetical protein